MWVDALVNGILSNSRFFAWNCCQPETICLVYVYFKTPKVVVHFWQGDLHAAKEIYGLGQKRRAPLFGVVFCN